MKWQIRLITFNIAKHGTHSIAVGPTTVFKPQRPIKLKINCVIDFSLLANLTDGLRAGETAIEDMFIRKFVTGTFHALVASEIIIKRQFNHIRIGALMMARLAPRKYYFLVGYTEEMLSIWLQCPVTLEIQTIDDPKKTHFKYI